VRRALRIHGQPRGGTTRGWQIQRTGHHHRIDDQGQQYFAQRYRERVERQLNRCARDLGMTLVPVATAA
jgi:hypothetical protein